MPILWDARNSSDGGKLAALPIWSWPGLSRPSRNRASCDPDRDRRDGPGDDAMSFTIVTNSQYKVLDNRDISDGIEPFSHDAMNYFAHWELTN
jgi:hypothetical protein